MTEHRWDAATGYCQRCGVIKGSHCWKCTVCPNVETSEHEVFCWKCGQGEMVYVDGCSAPENMISLQPYLAKRAWEKDGKMPDAPKTGLFIKHEPIEEKIIVETSPKEPA